MATLNDVAALKAKADTAREDAARARGALDQAMHRLKTEHGLMSIDAAKARLAELTKASEEAKAAFDAAYDAFMREWGDKL